MSYTHFTDLHSTQGLSLLPEKQVSICLFSEHWTGSSSGICELEKIQHENNALMRRPADDEAALAEAADGEESDVRVLEVDEIKSVERVAAT